ncbi:MAG: serine hydroxymethyltransferase [Leptospiraceae bacterium]|nr:serine hydroxymethyltransferase [Leptospiraceae bacterium]MDW7975930.1 serine hydroxymethyltransferase [Leptospiraceae bacterium]
MLKSNLFKTDPEVYEILVKEDLRQENSLEMIASENFVSRSVLEAYTSTLTNKYAEGYPGKRYYNGCEYADEIETLAIERAKKLFRVKHVNVQPHSGAQANAAVFLAFLEPKDVFLGMDLSHGGHLTHGSKVNFSGRIYQPVFYGVRKEDERIDFDQLYKLAKEHKPKMIIAGFSAYPRVLDFAKFREISDEVGAILMADIAHIAGIIAAGYHPSPVGVAHVITTTTHKTLRGPRGGLIMTDDDEVAKVINSRVFPGTQGGPLMHVIAAKAVAFGEALQPEFKDYIKKVLENAQVLAETFLQRGFRIVSGGTDNHIVLLDVGIKGLTGSKAADELHKIGITANKNTIPFDPNPPAVASGVRFGSPALTTRGLGKDEFKKIGNIICDLLENIDNDTVKEKLKEEVKEIVKSFPMNYFRLE